VAEHGLCPEVAASVLSEDESTGRQDGHRVWPLVGIPLRVRDLPMSARLFGHVKYAEHVVEADWRAEQRLVLALEPQLVADDSVLREEWKYCRRWQWIRRQRRVLLQRRHCPGEQSRRQRRKVNRLGL